MEYYPTQPRHWCSDSECFSSGDALMTALDDGWQIEGVIFRQDFWYGEGRRVSVFRFKLERDGEKREMVIVHNPFISRFVYSCGNQVVQLNHRKELAR